MVFDLQDRAIISNQNDQFPLDFPKFKNDSKKLRK